MGFFFTEADPQLKKSSVRKFSAESNAELLNEKKCSVCPRNKADGKIGKLQALGKSTPEVYVLGGAPSKDENKYIRFFSKKDDTGYLLRNELSDVSARFNKVIRCYSSSDIGGVELECCRTFAADDIAKTKPAVVLGIGQDALRWVMHDNSASLYLWRGKVIACQIEGHSFWFVPTYDPSLWEDEKDTNKVKDRKLFLQRDIDLAKSLVNEPAPFVQSVKSVFNNIEYVMGSSEDDYRKVKRWLSELLEEPALAIDLETYATPVNSSFEDSVFNPHSPNSKIVTMSLGTYKKTYAFPYARQGAWNPDQFKRIRILVKKFFMRYKGVLIAHNLKFEQTWLSYFIGKKLVDRNKWADTMAQGHALDERKGGLSLDTMCRQHFGFDLKVLSPLNKSALDTEPLDKVLRYNGGDVKFTFRLWQRQKKLLARPENKSLSWTYKHLVRSSKTLAHMQLTGLKPNNKALLKYERELAATQREVLQRIAASKEAKKFKAMRGSDFCPTSDKDVEFMFKTVLKRKEVHVERKVTKNGVKQTVEKTSTDKNVLAAINTRLSKDIIELREASKLLSTYIVGTKMLIFPDGMLHPSINLMFASTGRLSYEKPNGQNYPKRKAKYVRNVITSLYGWLMAIDYGQIEARVIGMASEDKVFCDALWNDYDVHMEWAQRLEEMHPGVLEKFAKKESLLDEDEKKIWKAFRNKIKNGWVFPQFFGSSPGSCARNMDIPSNVAYDLADEFWSTFTGVKKWQGRVRDFYLEHGYVETLTGRRRHGPLSWNEIINSPIQGTASDIVVDAANELYDADIPPILNVHDDLTSDVPKEGFEERARQAAAIMCKPRFDFINVPLVVEIEYGRPWGNMKEFKVYSSDKDFGYH